MKDRYIARSPFIAARLLDGEMIIMSAKDSRLFVLNEVATAIWQGADGHTTLRQIVENEVCAKFEVDLSTALEDAEDLTEELARHQILLLSDRPIEKDSAKISGGPAQEEP